MWLYSSHENTAVNMNESVYITMQDVENEETVNIVAVVTTNDEIVLRVCGNKEEAADYLNMLLSALNADKKGVSV